MSFKLIALRPLDNCAKARRKIIHPGIIYYFLNDYSITEDSITYEPRIPADFFRTGSIPVNVSAIVGKNGSGKSSLVELLMMAINNISADMAIATDVDLAPIDDLAVELYFESDAYYKIVIIGKEVTVWAKDFDSDTGFIRQEKRDFRFGSFFYSIVVNYSHYGLNSKEIGDWIYSLFHKNDGYQTPLVINPQRTEGNIDINSEHSLSKSRLITNILTLSSQQELGAPVTGQLWAYELELTLKSSDNPVLYAMKDESKLSENLSKGIESIPEILVRFNDLDNTLFDGILRTVNDAFNFGYQGNWETGDHITDLSHRYIIKKLIRIATTYQFYHNYFDRAGKKFSERYSLRDFLLQLFEKNRNHISFKLKQMLHFLRFRHIQVSTYQITRVPVKDLAAKIADLIGDNHWGQDAVFELIPPPIFETDIIMRTVSTENIMFEKLSSGEKQEIYSVSSVMYHLINVDSIRSTGFQKGYENVNIILEEIELYFHPDRQRRFVNTLLERIRQTQFQNVGSLGIIFVTHSPFILSDIPNSNILFLAQEGYPDPNATQLKTFGANIHDLLKNSFFLTDGSMGVFAMSKISETIQFLNYRRAEKELRQLRENEGSSAALIEAKKSELAELRSGYSGSMDPEKHKALIGIIAEPLIQRKLSQMYDQVMNQNTELEIVQARIRELQEREASLKKNQ